MCKEIIDEIKSKVGQLEGPVMMGDCYDQGFEDASNEILAIIDYVVKSWGEKDA